MHGFALPGRRLHAGGGLAAHRDPPGRALPARADDRARRVGAARRAHVVAASTGRSPSTPRSCSASSPRPPVGELLHRDRRARRARIAGDGGARTGRSGLRLRARGDGGGRDRRRGRDPPRDPPAPRAAVRRVLGDRCCSAARRSIWRVSAMFKRSAQLASGWPLIGRRSPCSGCSALVAVAGADRLVLLACETAVLLSAGGGRAATRRTERRRRLTPARRTTPTFGLRRSCSDLVGEVDAAGVSIALYSASGMIAFVAAAVFAAGMWAEAHPAPDQP